MKDVKQIIGTYHKEVLIHYHIFNDSESKKSFVILTLQKFDISKNMY